MSWPGIPDDLNALCIDLLRRDPGRGPPAAMCSAAWAVSPASPSFHLCSNRHRVGPHRWSAAIARSRRLSGAFLDMCQGRTVACYIHGPSGVGKSALVRRFLDDRIAGDEAIVLAGRCYEQESVPYKALDSVVDALGRYLKRLPLMEAQALLPRDVRSLVRVFPVAARGRGRGDRASPGRRGPRPSGAAAARAFGALRELLARLGDRRPLILAIDDLQWGDVDSAALLSELLRPPDSPRLLLLGCYRSDDAATSPFLRTLFDAREPSSPSIDRRMLPLETLEPAEAERLASCSWAATVRQPKHTRWPLLASPGEALSSSPSWCGTSRPMPTSWAVRRASTRWPSTRCSWRGSEN